MFVRRRHALTASDKEQTNVPAGRVGLADLAGRWWEVMRRPGVDAFAQQRAAANWPTVWLGLFLLAVVEALGVAYVLYGPAHAAGYSSLPIGPKAHLPQTPLLPLAALFGSIAQFFVFAGLLHLSARLFGGNGVFRTQVYLLALGWVPLMALSDLIEVAPGVGSVGAWLAVLLRLYTLCLCAFALAAAEHLSLLRAWGALVVLILAGLLVGLVTFALLGPHLTQLSV